VNLDLDGKVALVTGSSSGIGRAIAAAFLAEGTRVTVCGRDADRLAATAAELRRGSPDGVLDVPADVGQPADVARLVDATIARWGRLDIVVSNAGTHLRGTLEEVGVEQVEQHLRTKVLGAWELARLAAPHLRRRPGSRFIMLIGQAGKVPGADVIASALTNAAQHAFTKSLADYLGRDGVLVNAVCPSRIATPLTDTIALVGEPLLGRSLEQQASGWGREVPLGRWGTPADVASAVVFLASERASFLCGTNIDVDGGHQRSIL
jgi:3-oxoacyl-[acyl-carrier protein] reductase